MSTFTKGPWFATCHEPPVNGKRNYFGNISIGPQFNGPVAWIKFNLSREENEANARLIESAPDLFELVKKAAKVPMLSREANLLISKIEGSKGT